MAIEKHTSVTVWAWIKPDENAALSAARGHRLLLSFDGAERTKRWLQTDTAGDVTWSEVPFVLEPFRPLTIAEVQAGAMRRVPADERKAGQRWAKLPSRTDAGDIVVWLVTKSGDGPTRVELGEPMAVV